LVSAHPWAAEKVSLISEQPGLSQQPWSLRGIWCGVRRAGESREEKKDRTSAEVHADE
jgi:hypothetical protein